MPGDDVGSLATHPGSSSSSRKGHDDDIVIDDAAQATAGPLQAGAGEVKETAGLVFSLHLEIVRPVPPRRNSLCPMRHPASSSPMLGLASKGGRGGATAAGGEGVWCRRGVSLQERIVASLNLSVADWQSRRQGRRLAVAWRPGSRLVVAVFECIVASDCTPNPSPLSYIVL